MFPQDLASCLLHSHMHGDCMHACKNEIRNTMIEESMDPKFLLYCLGISQSETFEYLLHQQANRTMLYLLLMIS